MIFSYNETTAYALCDVVAFRRMNDETSPSDFRTDKLILYLNPDNALEAEMPGWDKLLSEHAASINQWCEPKPDVIEKRVKLVFEITYTETEYETGIDYDSECRLLGVVDPRNWTPESLGITKEVTS
jgi:hypothetical protein